MLKVVQQCGSNLSGENFECSVGWVSKGVQPCGSDLLGVLSHATREKYWPKNLSTWGCKENLVWVSDVLLCQNFYFKDFDYSEAAKRIWLEVLICFCVWIFYFLLCLLFKKKKQTKQNKKYSHLNGHWL